MRYLCPERNRLRQGPRAEGLLSLQSTQMRSIRTLSLNGATEVATRKGSMPRLTSRETVMPRIVGVQRRKYKVPCKCGLDRDLGG